MFRLGRDEYHGPRFYRTSAFRRFNSASAFDDEIEVLTILVKMKRRIGMGGIPHDACEHVIDLCQLFIDKERALPAWHSRDQLWQLILVENIGHRLLLS